MADEIHKNNTLVEITGTIKSNDLARNIASATQKKIIIQKPDTTILENDASFVTDGSDGLIKYISTTGDFDQVGLYKVQAYVAISGGSYYSNISSFKVHHNLE